MNTDKLSNHPDDAASRRLRRQGIPAAVAMLAFGILLLVLRVFAHSSANSDLLIFCQSVGLVLTVFGIVNLVRILWFLRHDKARRAQHIKETDERHDYITMRALKTTCLIFACASLAAMLVAAALSPTVFYTLLIACAAFMILYFVIFAVYDHRL